MTKTHRLTKYFGKNKKKCESLVFFWPFAFCLALDILVCRLVHFWFAGYFGLPYGMGPPPSHPPPLLINGRAIGLYRRNYNLLVEAIVRSNLHNSTLN